ILLVLTLLLSFSGYLLPWDQLAIWAITVGTNMARATPFLGYEGPGATFLKVGDVPLIHSGGDARFLLLGARFVGGDTLLRFYVLHCVAIPLAVAVFIPVHFWGVRKDGGISGALYLSFPRSAWKRTAAPLCVARLASRLFLDGTQSVPRQRSHAERGNERD